MTLWILGDSFCVDSELINPAPVIWQWHRVLTNNLKIKNIKVIAEFGSSNEYIIMCLINVMKEAKENDIIIVQTTESHRYWFLEKHPWYSNIYGMIDKDKTFNGLINKNEVKAVELYYKHIQNEEKDKLRLDSYYALLNEFNKNLAKRNIKMYVLPGFQMPHYFTINGYNVKGTLNDISVSEFTSDKEGEEWFIKNQEPDRRLNHMTKDNHIILADKLYETIKYKKDLDLTSGFRQRFLNLLTGNMFKGQLNPTPIGKVSAAGTGMQHRIKDENNYL